MVESAFGEFFTVRFTFAQISAMSKLKTCCILHNFVRQRDGFQFQDTLYECPLESIKAVGNRGNVTGTGMGRRAQRTGMTLCWRAWQRASLPGTYV